MRQLAAVCLVVQLLLLAAAFPAVASAADKAKSKKAKIAAKAKIKAKAEPVVEALEVEKPPSLADTPPWSMFKWQAGPTKAKLGSVAEVDIPAGFLFTGKEDTQRILQMWQNPISDLELGLIVPDRLDGNWTAIFEYSEVGYVKDEDKDEIDADDILGSIKEGTEAANEERREKGWPVVEIEGWATPPFYNDKTHHLEWAIKGVSEGETTINYNTRLLSRSGYMSITLLVDPELLERSLPEYQKLVAGYGFTEGNRYGDYRQGDKIAEYGLIALMAGGGAAIAAKTGLLAQLLLFFKKGWKLLIFGLAAVGAGIKKFFGRVTGEQ